MKNKLTRMSVGMSKAQAQWLSKEAARLQISLGEVLRRIIDKARGA